MQVFCEGGVFQSIVCGLEGGVGGGVEVVKERCESHAHFEWVGHDGGDASEVDGLCSRVEGRATYSSSAHPIVEGVDRPVVRRSSMFTVTSKLRSYLLQ